VERALESASQVGVPADVVREILASEPGRVLACRRVRHDARRFPVELRVEGGSGLAVHQTVTFSIAGPDQSAEAFAIGWVPVAHTRLLPAFRGTLTVTPEGERGARLEIKGTYRPPLGLFGMFGDGLIGHRAARRSLEALLSDLTIRLADEARQAAWVRIIPSEITGRMIRQPERVDGPHSHWFR